MEVQITVQDNVKTLYTYHQQQPCQNLEDIVSPNKIESLKKKSIEF